MEIGNRKWVWFAAEVPCTRFFHKSNIPLFSLTSHFFSFFFNSTDLYCLCLPDFPIVTFADLLIFRLFAYYFVWVLVLGSVIWFVWVYQIHSRFICFRSCGFCNYCMYIHIEDCFLSKKKQEEDLLSCL